VLEHTGPAIALLLGGGAGLIALNGDRSSRARTAMLAVAALTFGTLALAWLVSQPSPAWALRYFAVLVAPLLLLAAIGLARAGNLGLVALAVVLLFWFEPSGPPVDHKGNVAEVVSKLERQLEPNDLVIVTHPERVPLLDYYIDPKVTYADPLGIPRDTGLMDWRDALHRLENVTVKDNLMPLLDSLRPGARVLLVSPVTNNSKSWDAPWTSLVRKRSGQWGRAIEKDNRFVRTASWPPPERRVGSGIRAVLYVKS
jgi:hypothetical protein